MVQTVSKTRIREPDVTARVRDVCQSDYQRGLRETSNQNSPTGTPETSSKEGEEKQLKTCTEKVAELGFQRSPVGKRGDIKRWRSSRGKTSPSREGIVTKKKDFQGKVFQAYETGRKKEASRKREKGLSNQTP